MIRDGKPVQAQSVRGALNTGVEFIKAEGKHFQNGMVFPSLPITMSCD